jgi:N-acetylated-alpha-linked acidic dipeptidase
MTLRAGPSRAWLALLVGASCGGAANPGAPQPLPLAAPALSASAPLAAAATGSDAPRPPAPRVLGFAPATADVELAWEEKARAQPSADRMREAMRHLSARPHALGSAYDRENAQWILARFTEAGLEARIEEFRVLFPTPKKRVVEMVAPGHFTAKLKEAPVAGDPTTAQTREQLPTYNADSIDGDVSAPLVYVGYGLPGDYDALARLGVSVEGAIVLARYGKAWRGIKPKVAAEHGAIGCLLYSDPEDDGYAGGDPYPKGPTRPEEGVQRGSVMDFTSSSPGDPLTPGVGATLEAKRLARSEARSLTTIPVMPLSYGDAQPLLAALGGPIVTPGMRGGLPLPYHAGPGPARVHLVVQSSWDLAPVYDVIARIPGAAPDPRDAEQWIIRGNHHDAWVNGAWDPVSGQVALLEEARALGSLLKQGWRPRRTIVFAAWDGEEPYLMGSTEWAEAHEDELRRRAVAYVNSDANCNGELDVGGSHSLERLVNGATRDVQDPATKLSLWERKHTAMLQAERSDAERAALGAHPDVPIDALGSGSDFTALLDHTGVATLNLGFSSGKEWGVYHSIYDDFAWYTRFCDTDFAYGRALAQLGATLVMRLADADVLPIDLQALTDRVDREVRDLEVLSRGASSPSLDFGTLKAAALGLATSARRNSDVIARLLPYAGDPRLAGTVTTLNERLQQAELRLTSDQGLPRRPWYRHLVYAPGVYSGYDAQTLPGVREAIDEKRWPEAQTEIARLATALTGESALLDEASADIESATAKVGPAAGPATAP